MNARCTKCGARRDIPSGMLEEFRTKGCAALGPEQLLECHDASQLDRLTGELSLEGV